MGNLDNLNSPTEAQEQMAFVQWLRLKNLPHFRVPNETFTRSMNQKRKNTALGVSSGVPDLFVVIPAKEARPYTVVGVEEWSNSGDLEHFFNKRLVAIEMKRKKGGHTSENQKIWLEILNNAGVETVICNGCDEAIKFIEERIK
jgi:hypothetical protein